ncbi:MAG: acyl carrier protein [Sulfurovum sp.]|nr:MAG: acyl carrier protein [Sulfurovum sp.]
MTNEDFKKLMKDARLTKKSFSEILGTSYNAVNGWGTNNRGYPYWVQSWLELYIENGKYNEIADLCANLKESQN